MAARLHLSFLVGLSLIGSATPARAQVAGDLQLDPFRPAMDSRGYLTINATDLLGHGEVSFGLGSLSWGHGLLDFESGDNAYSVEDVITATLIAAVGVKLGPAAFELGVSAPIAIMNGDRGPDSPGPTSSPNDDMSYQLDGQGFGNVGLHLKTRFLSTSRPPHVGIGLIASVYLPTATKERFLGDGGFTPQLIGIVDKEFGPSGRFRIALNGGVRFRSTETFTDAGDGGAPPTGGMVQASAELPFGFGMAFAIKPKKIDLVAEVFGAIPLGDHANYQPLEAIGGVKLYLARNSFLSLGAGRGLTPSKGANPDARAFISIVFEPSLGDRDGDGLKDDVDKCPDDPEDYDGFEDEDGCPDLDNDNDKILDVDDLCPNDPEDYDGFEDEDGCPDLDNDKDRILDTDDKCINEPENYNNFEDDNGCPDRKYIELDKGEIVTFEPIHFEFNKAVIKSMSFPTLDAIVTALNAYPDIQLVEVAGHSDERGNDAYNLDLSDRRAKAVMQYLTEHGVDANRLEANGYGETQPKVDGHNEKAWSTNRRVDFLILKPSNFTPNE